MAKIEGFWIKNFRALKDVTLGSGDIYGRGFRVE